MSLTLLKIAKTGRSPVFLPIIKPHHHLHQHHKSVNFSRRFFFQSASNASDQNIQTFILRKQFHAPLDITYGVISEVSEYKHFIPYCTESWVSKRDVLNENRPMEGGLRVGFKQFDEKYVCKITCSNAPDNVDEKTVIAESLTHELFDNLLTKWTISGAGTHSNVELRLEFKFHSRLYNSVSSIFGKSVTELVMRAFNKRVAHIQKELYLQKQKDLIE